MTAVRHVSRAKPPARRQSLGQALHYMLHLAGFACSTLVMTWGVFAVVLLALGGFSLDGLMLHLANLSNRYVAADPGRIGAFKQLFAAAHFVIVALLIALRRHAILPPSVTRGDRSHG